MRLVTAAEMRDLDGRAAAEFCMPTLLLMENAGAALAEAALRMLGETGGRRIAVYCGKGNNGGDGLVAARHLAAAGCEARLFLGSDAAEFGGDAAVNLEIARRMGLPLRVLASPRQPWAADLAIDAVLGTGLRGEVTGPASTLIRAMQASGAPVLAADLPSGLDSDTGRLAAIHVHAARTVTLGLPKLGLALYPGRAAAGALEVAPIGMPRPLLDDPGSRRFWTTAGHVRGLIPVRSPEAHKGDAGRVFVLAGSEGMVGAAALAAEGALRGGAGLVTLGVPRSLIDVAAARVTEVMTLPLAETESRAPDREALAAILERAARDSVLAIGPGLGQHPCTRELLLALLRDRGRTMVLDADALNLLAPPARAAVPPQSVLTPHPAEMARLLGITASEVQADRVGAARRAAERFRCVVLLKGAATLVADPAGRLAVNSSGDPAMATGGCGDVLTGLIAALLAQGLAPFDAAVAGAYLHGLAGEVAAREVGGPGMTASDLLPRLPAARRLVAEAAAGLPPAAGASGASWAR